VVRPIVLSVELPNSSALAGLSDATVRHMVMAAAAMAAKALTDAEQPPEGRLRTLMDAHGRIQAARGPGRPLTFGAFRGLLAGDLSRLLPESVPAEEMEGIRLIASDGSFEEDFFDLEIEQRVVLRALAKTTRDGRQTSTQILEAEMDQDRVFSALRKRMDQDAYVHGRSSLIRTPAGSDKELRRLNLPSSVAEFYRPVTFDAAWDRWWFACPVCRWPMRVTLNAGRGGAKTGSVRCFHRPHAVWGASFTFKIPDLGRPPVLVPLSSPVRPAGEQAVLFPDLAGRVPQPVPVEGHKALTRGVWRWTTVPGLVEMAAETWRAGAQDPAPGLEALAGAVDTLLQEEQDPGGFRIRQVGQLVQEQTRREMGTAERIAARDSWSRFYRDTSGVLHGSASGAGAARALFEGLVAAIGQLFLGLPERAGRLRELAVRNDPSPEEAAEVALMTDPRAGEYFFRAAVSGDWLDLLPVERLLPESERWPAMPYLRRLSGDPQRVCAWIHEHLDAIGERGPQAVGMAVSVMDEAGIGACPVMLRILETAEDRHVLLRIGYWAREIRPAERTRAWVRVIEDIFAAGTFTDHEEWESAQLLLALLETAYPGGEPREDGGKLATGVRFALATALARRLDRPDAHWVTDAVNDLADISVGDTDHPFLFALMRAVLDLAQADARHGVALEVRTGPLEREIPAGSGHERLLAVHLRESYAVDCADPDSPSASAWWDTAVALAGRLMSLRSVRADVSDFLRHLLAVCPDSRRTAVEATLSTGPGPAPDQAAIDQWKDAYTARHERLPDRWHIVRELSPVLPATVLEPWQPLLEVLEGIAGPPLPRPEPLWQVTSTVESHGGLSPAPFAEQAAAEGPAAAVAALVRAVVPRDDGDPAYVYGGVIADLVAADPRTWASDPAGVAAAADAAATRFAYFNALHHAYQEGKLDPAESLAAVTTAAFALRPSDSAPDASGADLLRLIICFLLHRSWNEDLELGDITPEALEWLDDLISAWTRPRASTPDPFRAATSQAGGSALRTLIVWGIHRALSGGCGLPGKVTSRLDEILGSDPDDQALSVLGADLMRVLF
jgi:hypothetical protein